MFSFTAVLFSVLCLFYLQHTNCVTVDGHTQPRRFAAPALAKSERPAKEGTPGNGQNKAGENKSLKGETPSQNDKSSASPRIIRPVRKKLKSKYDLLHGMYTEYNFNWHFKSFALRDASSTKYSAVKDLFEPTIDEILAENQLPNLASSHGQTWKSLNKSLVESYENERGVIVYDQDFFRWVYCGWLIIDSENIRMCAPLLPLGLEDIGRLAVKNSDYIPKDTAKYLHDFAEKLVPSRHNPQSKSKNKGESMFAGLRKIVSKLLTVREDYWLVNLFADNADTYNQNCLEDNADNVDCSPICCYSTYIGSSFCTEHPMNCIYFKG